MEEKDENKTLNIYGLTVCDTLQNDGVWSSHFRHVDSWQNSLN